jgi:O-antigen ligase
VKLPAAARAPIQALLIVGLSACQSRGSAATLLVVLLVVVMRRGGARALVPVIGGVALAAMIWSTSQDFNDRSENAKFNSVNTRLETYDRSMELWSEQPVFGAGLRFWRDPAITGASEPHNLMISALVESGLVGTVAFVGFNVGILLLLRRRSDALGRAAFYLTLAHAIDAMAGIFWVAGTGTLPWLVVGLAAGHAHIVATDDPERQPDPALAR